MTKKKARRKGQTKGYFDLIAGPKGPKKARPRRASRRIHNVISDASAVVCVAEYVNEAGGFDEEWEQATEASRLLEDLRRLFELALGTRHPAVGKLQAALNLTDGLMATFDEMVHGNDDDDCDGDE